ncbi:MAG: hypothetical protein ACK4Z0_05280 [Sphingomonadaceae bacterium]
MGLALVAGALAAPAPAQQVPEPIKARVNELVARCVAAGGQLGDMRGAGQFVIPRDFNGDGRTDFLVSEGNVPCTGRPQLFRPGGLARVQLWLGDAAGNARLAFEDQLIAYRVLDGRPAKLQVARRGPACGGPARCGDELRWNAAASRFDLAPTDGRQAAIVAAPGAQAATAAAAPAARPASSPGAAKPGALPLKRGYFVSADTPCNRASNATVNLLTGDGINASRTACTFTRVEPQGGGRYRVTQRCAELGGWGQDSAPEVSTVTFEIPDDSRFTIRWPGGSSTTSRYCPQSTMNEPFRSNDIRDLVN